MRLFRLHRVLDVRKHSRNVGTPPEAAGKLTLAVLFAPACPDSPPQRANSRGFEGAKEEVFG